MSCRSWSLDRSRCLRLRCSLANASSARFRSVMSPCESYESVGFTLLISQYEAMCYDPAVGTVFVTQTVLDSGP